MSDLFPTDKGFGHQKEQNPNAESALAKYKKIKNKPVTAKDLTEFTLGEVEYLHSIGVVTWDVKRDYRQKIADSFKEYCTPLKRVK